MDLKETIKTRRSVRAYKQEPVPEEKLNKVLEAARLAPSAHNAQDWKLVVVKDSEKRKQLAEAANQDFIGEAPVIIVAVALDPKDHLSSGVPTYAVNLGIAIDHVTLQAWAEGLGTCWIGAFSQQEVKQVLNIPEQYKVVILLPLGYPADSPKTKNRKSIEELICYENFNE